MLKDTLSGACTIERMAKGMKRHPRFFDALRRSWRRGPAKLTLAGLFVALSLGMFVRVLALPDTNDSWGFTSSSAYTTSNGIDISGGTAHLKPYELASDSSTSALYNFNETSGTSATDASSNNNTLTASSSGIWNSGRTSGGAALGGTAYLTSPSSASLLLGTNHSIESHVKFSSGFNTSNTKDQYLVDKGNYKLYFDHTSGKLTYELAPSSLSIAPLNTEAWTATDTGPSPRAQAIYGNNVFYLLERYSGNYIDNIFMYNNATGSTSQLTGPSTLGSVSYTARMASNGSTLYVSAPDQNSGSLSSVYSCDMSTGCSSWTYLGGAFSASTISSLSYQNGRLIAGTSGSADNTKLYLYNSGTSWTQIGGSGAAQAGWTSSSYSSLSRISGDGSSTLYAVTSTFSTSTVWKCVLSGSTCTWTSISTALNSAVVSLTYFGSNLYASYGQLIQRYSGSGTTWSSLGAPSGYTWSYNPVITNDGTNLYASSQSRVFRCANPASTCTWTDISPTTGIFSVGVSTTGQFSDIRYSGSTLYATAQTSSAANALALKYTGGSWQVIPTPSRLWQTNYTSQSSGVEYNGALYVSAGHRAVDGSTEPVTTVFKSADNGSSWQEVSGNGLNNAWSTLSGAYYDSRVTSFNGNLYAGLIGSVDGDAEVWRYNGTSWNKIGGDGLNSSWTGQRGVHSFAVYNGSLYVGLGGTSTSSGLVYKWNDGTSTWSLAATTNQLRVSALASGNGVLYIGTDGADSGGGNSSGNGLVFSYNGTTLTGITSGSSSFGSAPYGIPSLTMYDGRLYASIRKQPATGYAAGSAQVWRYDGAGTTWQSIADGNGSGGSWAGSSEATDVGALIVFNGKLYALLNSYSNAYGSPTSGRLYEYDGVAWNSPISYLYGSSGSLYVYRSTLWSGRGMFNNNGDYTSYLSSTYRLGANYRLQSTTSDWGTGWHKVAASYNGTTMKLYVDGVEQASQAASTTVPSSSASLVVGTSHGGINTDTDYLSATIDDLRLSSVARSSFPDYAYNADTQTVTLTTPIRKSGIWHWDNWSETATKNGGNITYRFSTDGGSTWLWWNNTAWTTSSDTSQANIASDADAHISALPAGFGGITWQAVLKGDGTQQISLTGLGLASTSDTSAPSTNAHTIVAKKSATDATNSLSQNGWTNGASPAFSWSAGSDGQSGVLGYCLYVGTDSTADPISTKGMLGVSPLNTGGACQFAVSDTAIDLGTAGYLTSAFVTSNDPYYLLIKAIDKAGNIYGQTSEFHFRFDNSPPANPLFVTAPSGFINTKTVTLTWPTSGVNGPADANSGVSGLQYRIGNSPWYGDSHTGSGDANDLLTNDGTYTTQDPPDFSYLNEGVNTVNVRTWDQAGNISVGTTNAIIKLNTVGAPSEPLNLSVTPTTNTQNNFAFAWQAPADFVGDASGITYCYTVNILPSDAACSYTDPGQTSLPAGPYATQPGTNRFYLVARDESRVINYDNYSSIQFSANTPAPGIPRNVDVADVSVKATSNWRLALTWDVPSNAGAGIAKYLIYAKTGSNAFTQIGTSTSTSYIHVGLSQQQYSYKVVACDSANNCSADSSTVSATPTGKFTTPPILISPPEVSNITTRHATITWSTDRASDSKISIGTTSGHYDPPEVLISAQTTNHSVDLSNLSAGTTYYIMAKWTDEDGNTGKSQELSFTTSPAPVIKEVTVSTLGLTNATLSFTSTGAYRVSFLYGVSDGFGGIKSLNTSSDESQYNVSLDGLSDGTKYFYQPVAYDNEGNAYPGNIFSFTTPPRPRISELRLQPISDAQTSTQQITWKTNVPTDSTITYGLVGSNGTDVTKAQLVTDHLLTVSGLDDNSVYFVIAKSRDADGNLAVSDRQEFKTALDTRPPKISDITVETSIRGTGSQSRGQIIISWKTDEASTSQVAYGTGTNSKVLNSKTAEDDALSTEHIVIVSDLSTSELYTVQPISKDKAGNEAAGDSQTAIIGRGSDDVLTIVVNTFKKLFGL